MTRPQFPPAEDGRLATTLGTQASDAGDPITACPYDRNASFAESCLAAAWRKGWRYAQQARLQAQHGDAPTPKH